MGEVAERSSDGEVQRSRYKITLSFNKRPKALSVSAAPSQLSQRESQGRLFDMFYLCAHCSYSAERRTAPHPPPMAVPLPRRGRFCVVPLNRTGYIRDVAGGRLPPLHARWRVVPFNQRIPKPDTSVPNNCQLSTVNCKLRTNCQLSIFPFPAFFAFCRSMRSCSSWAQRYWANCSRSWGRKCW